MTTEEPEELRFLRECYKEKTPNFDNSDWLPKRIKEKYKFSKFDCKSVWHDYTYLKFRYLLGLEQSPQISDDDFIIELKKKGSPAVYMEEFVKKWKDTQKKEQLAYLYRYTQLPLEIVHEWWYPQKYCNEWCELRQNEIEKIKEDLCNPKKPWETGLKKIYGEIPKTPDTIFFMELGLTLNFRKGLTERIEGVSEDLKIKIARLEEGHDTSSQYQDLFNDITNNFRSLMSEYGVLSLDHPNGSFLADLSITLIDTLYREYFNEDALIRSFLFELKKKFNCEVCDFVEVEEDGNLLVWRIATVSSGDLSDEYQKKDIEDVRLLSRKHESYKKGQGISGSMLLIEDDPKTNFWHHIGSNDVPNDPRAAAHISHAYEQDVYPKVLQEGKIHNFWMFPIFLRTPPQQLNVGRKRRENIGAKTDCETASSDRELFGAFRVVNKLDSQGKLQPSGWPYITRLELSLIAGWFSKFFMALKPILQRSEEFAFISWGRLVDELIANTGLQDWIDRDFFSLILRHFARITFKKEEKRIMGSSVLIEENTNEAYVIGYPLVNYPGICIGPNEIGYPYYNLDSYLDMVDPLNGVFIFDEKGVFQRIATLEYPKEKGHVVSGSETIRKITGGSTRSIFILLPRDKHNILFYMDREKVAELYFAERTGEWKFRSMGNIREILKNNSELDLDVLNIIMETSLELSSRRWGGLIVVGSLSKDTFSYDESHTNFQGFSSITKIGPSRLVDFVKLDGATIIDPSGSVTSVNTIIRPIENRVELKIFKDRGGRHKTGEEICRLAPEALVIIISENGGISILKNGEALLKNG